MRNAGKKNWFTVLIMSLGLALLVPAGYGFSVRQAIRNVDCSPPDPSVSSQGSGSITFTWEAKSGATSYQVYYFRAEDSYTSSPATTGSTSISFSHLPQGTYDFYFCTNCGGESSDYIILDDLIM